MPRFCLIGSYTGRNAGDAAILENVVRDIADACSGAVCEVPTINPAFMRRTYPDLPIVPVATLPWNLSIKTLGLPLILSVLRCDAVLVTSAILFDIKFWNPLYNYLSALMLALPLAKRLGKKVFFYSIGVGPVHTAKGRTVVRYLLNLADGVTLREEASAPIMRELGVRVVPIMAADPALNQRVPQRVANAMRDRVHKDIGSAPYVTLNLNAYVGGWTGMKDGKALARGCFEAAMAEVVRRLVDDWRHGVALICTHYMDEPIMETVLRQANRAGSIVLYKCREYDHRQLMAVMGMSRFMIGMRLHCQILAVAAGTPCIALNYAPKVRHFMRMAGLEEFVIDLGPDFCADQVLERCERLGDTRETLLPQMLARVHTLKSAAKNAPVALSAIMDSLASAH